MSLEQLKKEYQNCQHCPSLVQSRRQVVFGSGNEKAEVLLVGEAPGFYEDKEGIPFCGESGKVLNELLKTAGIPREDVFITNTVLCRPENNRNPTSEEVDNCRERLDKLIGLMRPKVIVTIGNFATGRILEKVGIKSLRGKVFIRVINDQEIKVVPVVHPASYLYSGRNPELLKQMKQDFQTIAGVVKEKK